MLELLPGSLFGVFSLALEVVELFQIFRFHVASCWNMSRSGQGFFGGLVSVVVLCCAFSEKQLIDRKLQKEPAYCTATAYTAGRP